MRGIYVCYICFKCYENVSLIFLSDMNLWNSCELMIWHVKWICTCLRMYARKWNVCMMYERYMDMHDYEIYAWLMNWDNCKEQFSEWLMKVHGIWLNEKNCRLLSSHWCRWYRPWDVSLRICRCTDQQISITEDI